MHPALNMHALADREQIDLLRGGSIVSSFAGALGCALRETRLTAMLGYLIALEPERFCNIFAFCGRPLSVRLEAKHASDPSDILIETTAGRGVIEAKVTTADPFLQALKYPARWRVLLTQHTASGKQKRLRGVKFLRLLSNICGLTRARGGVQACDRERFPGFHSCENRTTVW
jgi:hypothetical protein